ncbi:PREDICTED: dynein heavy chain domain-containing protein 1 isoform X15 [Cercocebus atys]|uniref:dynein heavy chain domain-containing protein 1 isoform X15 n=1 Tax=Cercocebus atys TaxID=9531 RepID=UPI0005F36312|nr:PREDICTED: dynein heavy chain domain-containing protein 1 isoform X15 [Cercocebus atys]
MIRVSLGLELKSKFIHCFSRHSSMKPHQKIGLSSLALPPKSPRPGEARHLASWNWQLEPELWARSLRQQLNAQLLMVPEEKRVGLSSDETSSDALKSWHSICVLDSKEEPLACQQKRRQFVKPATESEQPTVLELLLAELRTLFSAVLQDSSPAAWRYLHAVLGLLPPYRELLVGHLDLLPFLEQLYCWAPWVQTHLHLDLLGAINQAFPPDSSLLDSASHADCCPQKQRLHHRPPCPACPFVQARWSRQQVKEELATWLRPLTLPELQRCLGIVGAQVALEEAVWLDGLSLLPLALATDIPVQYESSDTDNAEEEPVGRKETRSQLDYEVPREKTLQKSSTGFSPETSFLGSQVMTALKTERYLKKIHFLYLNVAPSRYFRPYSLMVVPPDKVNAEHYIFSPFGILHVHPVEGSETMTLGTWHHHCVLWQQLQFIPFFKYCLLRKSFTCWKKNVRLQGLHRLRNFLENHLLLAVPHFGAGLLHISRLLQELHSVSWLPQELDRCYELLDLQKALAKEKHKALRLLHRCLNLCTSILRLVHEDTYHMQQGLQERVQNCDRIRAGQGSIYLQRVQRKQLEQKLKQAEAWWLQLGKFARLVDYMICQSLISILEEQITSFVANILQAPRQKPFLSSQLVFDDHDQLSHVPCVENMIQILTGGLQSVKTSALQVVQSADLKTSSDSLYSEEEDEEEDSKTEFLMPKFQGQPSDAVSIFCGPNVGLVWPWKSHPIAGILEVHGYRLRGQYFPRNYKQLEEDLNNNPQIQQALNIQQVLLEGVLWEVQEFCREHHWITGIYEFLQSWVPQKLEDMRGGPIKNYVTLVSRLNVWQARVSSMPVELLTKGKLLLLSCRDVQTEMESKLDSIRKDILAQVQNECWSLSQQLMTELTNFMHVFRTINSDIHAIAQCTQKLNEANEQYVELEERMEYVRALHELIRNHFSLFSAENEALDISVRRQFRESSIPPRPPPPRPHLLHCPLLAPQLLDMWEAFQFEKSQASEFLLSKRHAIIPKLQQLMAAALAELEGLLGKALSGPFMDPTQDQRSTEHQLISLERQFQNTVSDLSELHHAYVIFTEDETPVPLPICGTRPIVQQQRIWHLYRVISENISEWKCMAFAKFSLAMAQEKTEGWLTEAARMSTTLGLNSPVLQHCMRILGEFRSYLPLLAKLGSLQPQSLNCQCLLRALGLGSLQTIELLTLGQLLTYPLLEFADRINQVWQNENERIHAQETIQQLQRYWEVRQLRLLNFILHVPYEPPASERSKRQVLRSPQWEVVDKDSGTFILSDYSNLQDSIQESLQVLSKILAIQKSGDLNKTALEWMAIMHGLGALLEVWLTFQQKWIFLNKVLHEMKIQFPNADLNSRFKVVDDQYRTLMRISVADPMVLSLVVPSAKRSPYFQGQQLQQLLQAGSVELEGIIMTLESVLYGVCAHFPRLFFLSDSELVALLAARLESCEAQLWVRRCFPHVHAVRFKSCPTERELVSGPLPCRLPLLKQILEDTIQTLNVAKEEPKCQQPRSLAAIEEAALLHALLHSPLFSVLNGLHLHNLRGLLCALFPSASQVLAEAMTYKLMKALVVEELQQVGLHPSPDILGSLEQLSQALSRASGILLLGPAGSGKTTCWHSLFKIQNRLAAMEDTSTQGCQPVEITHLYPSGLSPQEFLGWLEGSCWHHGIFPKVLRAAGQCNNMGQKRQTEESMGIQHWIICDGASSAAWLDSITCLLSELPQLSLPSGQQIARPPGTFLLMEVADATGISPTVVGCCALVWCGGEQTWQCILSALMASLPYEYRLQHQTVAELNHMAEVLVPATFRFLARQGVSSLLQVHGQQAVCAGVAEVTSMARILHSLLDPHLRLKEEKAPGPEDLSCSDSVAQSFRSSKSSFLNRSQVDSDDVPNKCREHLLAVSSFLFALIWGFGAHLPSRFWPVFDTFIRDSISRLSNYPEPPPSALVFDLHVSPEDGTLVPFTGQYLSSHIKGTLGTFHPSIQTERLLYVVDLLLSRGQPVLLAGEAATGKSVFVEVLVEPHHPYIYSPIHPAFSSTHLRLLLSRGIQGQTQASPQPGHHQDSKASLLFLLEDLHLATSDPEKSCQPVLETLRQAMDGTVYAHSTLELQTLQPTVNFLATVTVPGYCERPLCPRLFRLFTVLALESMTQATLLDRHVPIIQAWLERFPSVERERALARALVRASVEAWEAVCNCFMPSPLHPHYHFSPHSVSHLLSNLQLLPNRTGSRGFVDYPNHQEHLRRVSGLRGTRLTIMMATRNVVRLWLHEAQRTFCDRLDSPRERSYCAKLLLVVAQSVFCCGPGPQNLGKDHEEDEEEEERVPEVESEGELAQWEDFSNSNSETEEEEEPYGLQVATGSNSSDPSLTPSIGPVSRGMRESISHKIRQEKGTRASNYRLQVRRSFKTWWQKAPQMDLVSPLLLPVLLLHPQEKPSDVVFSQELTLGPNSETPNLYLERQWEKLEEQLATSAAQLKLSPHLARCHSMAQHVARLVRVLARPRQHGLLLSGALGTGRHTAITLASSICQTHFFHLPSGSEEDILQCLRDASWRAGLLSQPVALLVPSGVDLTTLHRLLALATSGSFPGQYTEADLDRIEEHFPRENLGVKQNIKKEMVLQRFHQQVCSHLHLFFLIGDKQAHKQLPSTLFLRLLQLATASIDRYEPWDQAALVKVAQHHLEGARSLPLDDGSWKYPDLQASIPSVAKAMALIHLSATHYHEHLCPALPLVTPKTFLDFLDTFLMLQQQTILKIKNKAQRVQNALDNLRMLIKEHGTHANLISDLEQQLKASSKSLSMFQQQLEQSKLLYKQQLEECRHQENLIEDLAKQRDALQAQQEAFLEQMSKAFLEPLSQLQVADFEEIRSYRAPPESVVRVTDAMCDLFHRETGWASAKQLLCTEDFYQELVFFPKEKITDSQLIKLHLILKAPGMSDAALRAVSRPAASLAAWLWAVLHYGLAHCRGLPTGLLLQQVEATLIREQARLGYYQFQAQETLENNLALAKMVEDAQASHNCVAKTLSQAQRGQYHKWPMKAALLMPMHAWTIQLQKLKGRCMTVFGDALLCSAAIIYLGPFPPLRRQELLDKWLALCRGFQEALGPDDVAQALKQKQKSVSIPPKNPLLATHSPFNILSLLSSASEQYQWDGNLKPQAKSAHLAGLLLRSPTHYSSCRWPLLLDPSNQALMWLDPLSLAENRCLAPAPTEGRGKGLMRNQNTESKMDMKEEDDDSEDSNEAEDQTKEQKAEERKNEQEKEQEENEEKEEKTESQGSKPAYETQLPSLPYLSVLSGADPELGSQLQEAAACGLPVLLTNVELGLGCQELQWLLQREQLSPPQVQPGFCLYLSTTLSLCAMEKVLGCELLKGLNVLDLGLNMEILEEQMLHEILCRECPELETRWQNLKIRALDTCKAVEAAEERLLTMLLFQNPKRQKPAKFLRNMVRAQGKLCQLRAHCEELEGQKLQEMVSWAPYRPVVWHGIAMVKALSQLQNLLPLFRMSPEKWLAVTKQALDSMKPREINHGEDLASHLLQLRAHLTRQLLGSTVTALGLTQVPLVGALGALALLQVTGKASELERLALWPGLAASPSTVHSKPVSGVARPAWLGPKAWHECEMLELLPPFVGLCASLAGHSNAWQAYLSLSSTVLGPAPGPGPEPLSLLQKLILWRVLRPECLAGALADFTTSLLGRPLDENMGAPTMPFKHSRATQPMLILLPLPGHPTATLHPLTVIQNLAAKYQQGQKHLQVIALGSEVWDPVSVVVSTLSQAMYEGHWLVLDNCHLMPHWPKELLQLLLELLGRAKVVADLESEQLLGQPESRNVATVHRDFRLWLIVPAESSASLPAVLTQHSMPVFWNQSLELGHVLIDSVELAQQGLYMQPPTQALPLLLLHGLLLHRQLYGTRLQAHRGRWSQVTLTQVLQTQDQLWASLSNPRAAMQELAASVFYGGPLGDTEDREALFSLTQACLSPSSRNWVQPHTPQSLLATLMPLPELRELDAMAECKAQMHLLPSPPEPRLCGLSEGPQAWLLRRQSRVLLSALQRSSPVWVPESRGGAQLAERRLRQRLVQVNRRLESLQDLLTNLVRQDESGAPKSVLGPNARRPLEGVLETEALELSRLVGTLQRDLDCLLQQLKGAPPCPSRRCAAVAHALWTGRLPLPWRPHAPAGPQPPWHWLRQLSRRGQLLVRYLGVGADANSDVPERVFHLSAFRHPRRLLLALRGEAALDQNVPSSNFPGSRGAVSSPLPYKRLEMNSNPLHLRVENGPNPTVPERGLLLIGLQVLHAEWDPIAGALQDSPSSQASPLPPVSISTQAPGTSDLPPPADLPVYSCPVYMGGPLGNTKLQSRNIVMHLPLPTKLTPNTCVQRRVHVCSPPLS